MTRSTRREMLQPASAFALLSTDWLAWLIAGYFDLGLGAVGDLWAAGFAGICVWLVEGLTREPLRALVKALLAAAIVWTPGLALGTAVGLLALAWWLSLRAAERHERNRP